MLSVAPIIQENGTAEAISMLRDAQFYHLILQLKQYWNFLLSRPISRAEQWHATILPLSSLCVCRDVGQVGSPGDLTSVGSESQYHSSLYQQRRPPSRYFNILSSATTCLVHHEGTTREYPRTSCHYRWKSALDEALMLNCRRYRSLREGKLKVCVCMVGNVDLFISSEHRLTYFVDTNGRPLSLPLPERTDWPSMKLSGICWGPRHFAKQQQRALNMDNIYRASQDNNIITGDPYKTEECCGVIPSALPSADGFDDGRMREVFNIQPQSLPRSYQSLIYWFRVAAINLLTPREYFTVQPSHEMPFTSSFSFAIMKFQGASSFAAIISLASSYTIFTQLQAGSVTSAVGPITNVTSNDIVCNGGKNPTTATNPIIQVQAGSTVKAIWRHTLTSTASDVIDPSHKGPVMAYLKKVTNAVTNPGYGKKRTSGRWTSSNQHYVS
ncbi:hypothetical protein BDZ45DRAFT_738233 [Acephala macrosclerotiorum]|nr:hypothetical protein BDZ45DRAFT_738233 [Acephala macrosclerotiorum]